MHYILHNENNITMKICLFDNNHTNTIIRDNKDKKIIWLINRRQNNQICQYRRSTLVVE